MAVALAALLAACSWPASAQRDPTDSDRLIAQIEALERSGDENLMQVFGLPEWTARVQAAARRFWIDEAGRPGTAAGEVAYTNYEPSSFSFDRFDLSRSGGRWEGRWVHVRRVEVTAAASRAFPLDGTRAAWERHGRNAAFEAYQRERAALLPDPAVVARSALVRIEVANEASCPGLRVSAEQALALAASPPEPPRAAGPFPHVLTVGATRIQGRAGAAAEWRDAFWRATANCWRVESINNADRRWP